MDDEQKRLKRILDDPHREDRMNVPPEGAVFLPLLGYRMGTLSDSTGFLTIEYLPPEPAQATQVIRFAIARSQCTELGQALVRLAVQPHNPNARAN
jgi:hypothetical protein